MDHVLERSLVVDAPLDEVFRFFGDAGNLERITPPELRFRIVTPLPIEMRIGAEIRYRLSLFGIPFGWTTEITCWEPGRRFVDDIAHPVVRRELDRIFDFRTETCRELFRHRAVA